MSDLTADLGLDDAIEAVVGIDPLRQAYEAVSAAPDNRLKLEAIRSAAVELAVAIRHGNLDYYAIEERLIDLADSHGLIAELTLGAVEKVIVTALKTPALSVSADHEVEPPRLNGHADSGEPPDDGWQPPTAIPESGETERSPVRAPDVVFTKPTEWSDAEPSPVDWVSFQRIPRGDVSTLHGDGGAGKTDVALQLLSACARKAPDWLGSVVAGGPCVFLSFEEPREEIHRRLHRLAERDGYSLRELSDLHFWFPDDLKDCALAVPDKSGVMQPRPLFEALERRIANVGPVLVGLDSVAASYIGEQVSRVHARTYLNLFRGIARGPSRPAVLLLDHPSLSGMQAGTGRSGNMDWRNGVRSGLYLRPSDDRVEADAGLRILEVVKSNYGPIGEKVKLRWSNGGFAIEGGQNTLQQTARQQQAEDKFLELLGLHNRLGVDVGYSPGRNYAPKVFAEHPECGGYTNKALAGAMQRLLPTGKIELEPVGPRSKGKKRLVIANGGGR